MKPEIIPQSHVDHGLSPEHLAFVLQEADLPVVPSQRGAFYTGTVHLPDDLSPLMCGLHGPAMGDAPVPESEVTWAPRGERRYNSRLVSRPRRETRLVSFVAGMHEGRYVLFTAFGGPVAPREVYSCSFDTTEQAHEAAAFWEQHALSA